MSGSKMPFLRIRFKTYNEMNDAINLGVSPPRMKHAMPSMHYVIGVASTIGDGAGQ